MLQDETVNNAAGVLEITQLVSAVLNPAPDTVTTVPEGPEIGLSVIVGVGVVTVKVA
jgi:hypothetical protein